MAERARLREASASFRKRKGNKKLHSKVTLNRKRHITKKDLIVEAKTASPWLSLREIADFYSASHGYARRVWSEYVRKQVTNRERALESLEPVLPFAVHGSTFWNEMEPRFYDECPLPPSPNRNGQKVFSSDKVSFVIHKTGKIRVYPHCSKWKETLRDWLVSWMDSGWVDALLNSMIQSSGRHYCVSAPGIPTGYRLRLRGLGTFASDQSPFKKGTMEYEVDPGFERRLEKIEESQDKIFSALQTFAIGMQQHMALIEELRSLVQEIRRLNKKR